jgi:hypothetical protein
MPNLFAALPWMYWHNLKKQSSRAVFQSLWMFLSNWDAESPVQILQNRDLAGDLRDQRRHSPVLHG